MELLRHVRHVTHRFQFSKVFALLLLSVFLLAGCETAPVSPDSGSTVSVKRLDSAPSGIATLGTLGAQFEISKTGGMTQRVEIPLTDSDREWLQEGSLHLAWWNDAEDRYAILSNSFFDPLTGSLVATVNRDGRYAVFGMSRIPMFADFQRQICNLDRSRGAMGISPREGFRMPDICPVILCPAFDARAWGRALAGPEGQPLNENLVAGHFANACDVCLRRDIGPGDFPECGIPREPVYPPDLEQLSIDIRHGGRAVAIAVDPENDDTMVVASETGGLFRTTNRANNWQHRSGFLTFDFNDVAFSTTNPDRVIASADRDTWVTSRGGLYWSDDKGASWNQASANPPSPDCLENWGATGVDYEPLDDRFWAATNCGIAFSDDHGETWDYLPPAPGYTQTDTRAVIAPQPGHLKILRGNRVRVTEDGGMTWSTSTAGLPSTWIRSGTHNQIAVSQFNHEHIFWTFNYWIQDPADPDKTIANWALYLSTDNGSNWSMVLDTPGINRPPFVRTTLALSGGDGYDVYHANGGGTFQRATVANPAVPVVGAWTRLSVDHADHSDVAFANDGRTPLLLSSDGGLHWTEDDGLNWTYTPDMGRGYNALQITEVTGQLTPADGAADLYFGTQDNDIWGSPDEGATWPGRVRAEGFFLNVWRDPLPADETRVNGVRCAGCGNFISDAVLTGAVGFPNAPNSTGNPRLLKPENYIQRVKVSGVDAELFSFTPDTGVTWTTLYGFTEPRKAFPEVSYASGDPVVFSAVKLAGTTPDGAEVLGIKRIDGVLGSSTPVVSDVPGISGLGTFPTMFAWYKPYGVDPENPNLMIAPDIVADQVMVTGDGGVTPWVADMNLTNLVTANGDIQFHWGQFGQVSTIGFDPDCNGHILVGTRQAGVLRSFDGGATWSRVNGTLDIPRISRFFFAGDGKVILSSYGRGLWRMRYACPGIAVPPRLDWTRIYDHPLYFFDGRITRLDALDLSRCAGCELRRAQGGTVPGFDAEVKNQEHSEELKQLIGAGNGLRAGLVNDGKLQGLVLASEKIDDREIRLPPARKLEPYIVLQNTSLTGLPISETRAIVIRGIGFDRNRPVRILVDGEPLPFKHVIAFDAQGRFELSFPPAFELGGHTVAVEQETDSGLLRDVTTFHLTVQDPRGDEKQD